ncbi:aminotransferase class I/II-fold pyridoxal phosphate-dependent enzyme [Streptomyces sp. NBC_00191]|uniref:aminotransferase class I/II-fold pyridoxal phosphate-dependent enzyme n=1 Tax=Streptomyces sp. NBC_00191 TaxID=2975674 RepID=UPI0032508362
MLLSPSQALHRDPAHVQGGDLSAFLPGQITLDLSVCSNRMGPPPQAIEALRRFLADHPSELVPPPYRAEEGYLAAYADHLGVDRRELLPLRGVTEGIGILSRLLRDQSVALVTPDCNDTMQQFHYATFLRPERGSLDTTRRRLKRVRQAMAHHRHVVISNPNNPYGHFIPGELLLDACRQNPHCTLIVDMDYVEFQGKGMSLAGAALDADNLVVMQSSGKTYGLTAARAGVMWTRNRELRKAVASQLLNWPLSLLDIVLHTAALRDPAWLDGARRSIKRDAHALDRILTARFGAAAVAGADIHFRFVRLDSPRLVHAHLKAHGIAVRMFDGASRGTVSGVRVATPHGAAEFAQLGTALSTLPREVARVLEPPLYPEGGAAPA